MKLSEVNTVLDLKKFLNSHFLYVVDKTEYPFPVTQCTDSPQLSLVKLNDEQSSSDDKMKFVAGINDVILQNGRREFTLEEEGEIFDKRDEAYKYSLDLQVAYLQQVLNEKVAQLKIYDSTPRA